MRVKILIPFFATLLMFAINSALGNDAITTPNNRPSAIVLSGGFGKIASSQEFITRAGASQHYKSYGAKYVLYAKGDRWEDYAYRMPYYGVGISHTSFGHPDQIGAPFSLYLVQGASAINFTHSLSLNYEFNLGAAFGWEKYNAITNPENILISTDVTVHVGINFYIRWYLSREFDLHAGFAFTHFSNGKWQLPNKGLNNLGGYIETSYNFNRPRPSEIKHKKKLELPDFKPYFRHDLHLLTTATNINSVGEGCKYNNIPFTIIGLDYYLLRAQGRMFHYGVGVEAVYDESGGATVTNHLDQTTGKYYTTTKYGGIHDQLSLNVAARLEFVQSLYTIFMDFAINATDPDAEDMGFAQTLGIKVYPYKSFFGTFGIKATDFQIAKYLYLGVGYTFNAKK